MGYTLNQYSLAVSTREDCFDPKSLGLLSLEFNHRKWLFIAESDRHFLTTASKSDSTVSMGLSKKTTKLIESTGGEGLKTFVQ